jgi:hypothetical protein
VGIVREASFNTVYCANMCHTVYPVEYAVHVVYTPRVDSAFASYCAWVVRKPNPRTPHLRPLLPVITPKDWRSTRKAPYNAPLVAHIHLFFFF